MTDQQPEPPAPDDEAPDAPEDAPDEVDEVDEVDEPPQQVRLRPHDPGSPFVTPAFRGDRWQRAGASDDELEALRAEWDAAEPEDRLAEQQRIDSIADPDLAAQLRERREAAPKRPGLRAKAGAWKAYARQVTPERAEEIEAMTRNDLIAEFGGE